MNQELLKFIADSKKNGYASTTSKWKKVGGDGSKIIIKKGNYTYEDTYFGGLVDSGQERVYNKGKVIWIMAYRGGIIPKFESMQDEAFSFLKKCIGMMPKEFPARGPKSFKEEKFRYENKWEGNIEGFIGEENIYFDNILVCFRHYLGGLIKNK